MKRDREIEEMFLLFDKNRSGTLELNEIGIPKHSSVFKIHQFFQIPIFFYIYFVLIQTIAGMFRENGIKISLKIIRRMFGLIDNDSSGSITFSEFKGIYNHKFL